MIALSANLSDPLLALMAKDGAAVDAVEVGEWSTPERIREYRRQLPELPFHFHGGDLIEWVGFRPGAVRRIEAYRQACDSPWASLHITMWLPGMVSLMLRRRWRLPLPNPERATRRFIGQVRRLARALPAPVTLENTDPLPFPGYVFEVQPARIARVLEETGCGLLLDTGHARVSAATLGVDVHSYLEALPLARVVQVHVSGPREREGRLVDAHEPMLKVDYDLLAWVLERTAPQVVTLEYIRERAPLAEQLARLRAMLG